jgi:gliding motility-associated lipoprotein GldH
MKRALFQISLLMAFLAGCAPDKGYQAYHMFPDKTWHRFNILQFEIPVNKSDRPVNVVFFARHDREYPYDSLAFNMIMKMPSGEERTRECRIKIKDRSGKFIGTFTGDSCEMTFILKKELNIPENGMLMVELENLVPRMRTPGLYGVGIRLEKP